ncbi:MAG TPA: N-acetyltransferase, partial [Polyangia bacterium]|nr:N-acetyltransferase [Polyangia bacterium]
MAHFEQARGKYRLSTERARIDVIAVHAFLNRSYWAEGISVELVERAIAGSLCFSVLDDDERQVGFARVVTDRSTFAYLCDVF